MVPFGNRSGVAAVAAALLASALARAGGPQAPAQPQVFRAETEAVWVTVTAIDADGRLVTDLGRDDFEVLVDGVVQPINQFRSDSIPFALSIMFDLSGSLGESVGTMRRAMTELINQFRPGDRANVGSFHTLPSVDLRFSSNRETLIRSTAALIGAVGHPCRGPWNLQRWRHQTDGFSGIWDAVACSIDTVASDAETPRRVVLLITDGFDNVSFSSQSEVQALADTYGVMVYVLAMVGTKGLNSGALRSLAAETGGGYFVLNHQEDMSPTFARIAEELRHQYVLGYSGAPGAARQGKLEVRVKRTGITARGRRATMTVVPVAPSVKEVMSVAPPSPPSYSMPPAPSASDTVFDRAARNTLRPSDLPQLSFRGMQQAALTFRRNAPPWIRAGGPAMERTRRLHLATYVLDFLSVQDQLNYWDRNSAPGADLLGWASEIVRTGTPDSAERFWHLAGVALLQRFGAVGPLEMHLTKARDRFPNEPQFRLATAVAADMRLWPQKREEHGFVADADLTLRIFARYNELLSDPAVGQEARVRLGYFELLRGRRAEAFAHFEQAGVPADPELRYTLDLFRGQAFSAAGRHTEAMDAFRRALAAVPAAQSATIGLCAALVNLGRHNEAEAIVSRMLSMPEAPFDPWTIYTFPAWRHWTEWRENLQKAIGQ